MLNFLILFIFYLPFQVALNPSAGIDLASIRILILGFFVVWLAQGLKNKNIFIKKNIQTGLILTFLFLNLVSIVVAKNTDWSIRKLLFLFSIFPIYFVANSLLDTKEKVFRAVRAIVFSGTFVAAIGLIQFLAQFIFGLERVYKFWADYVIVPFLGKTFSEAVLRNPSWLVNISGQTYLRATATFPDPHMFSFFLGMIIPFAFALLFLSNSPLHQKSTHKIFWCGSKKIFYSAALAILLLTDAATFSRGGYLGLFAGLVLAALLSWNKLKKSYKISIAFLAVLSVAILVVPSPISQRYFSSFNLKEGSNKGRIETWQKAKEVIFDNPIIGVGIGNYPLEIKPTADYREPIYAHNAYLDIAAETGILNSLVFIGILMASIFTFLHKSRENLLFVAGAISLVIFSIHSLVETAIYSPVVLTLLLLVISFSSVNSNSPRYKF